MVNLKQHSHSPRDVGRISGHNKKNSAQGTLLALSCVLYVDDGAFPFEDRDQITQCLYFIFSHFTIFGLEMKIGKGDKSSKPECVFFPPPGFFERKSILPVVDGDTDGGVLVPKSKQEYYKSRHKREELDYNDLSDTRLIFVVDRFVTFFRHFKYLGTWISFSLRDDHNVIKRLATTNASMGAISKIC